MEKKAYFNWSGGKDSALALHHMLSKKEYSLEMLVTSINQHYGRISMHGIREKLLDLQATSLGLPLQKLFLSEQPSMEEYNTKLKKLTCQLKDEGFQYSVFGDIFLEDLKKYREEQLGRVRLKAVFPIWKRDTRQLLEEFLALGFKTVIVCIDAEKLNKDFAGRIIDNDFLKDLPGDVDPCGENGEFHTFVFDGPIFKHPIPFQFGDIVYKEYEAPNGDKRSAEKSKKGFWFCDLLPEKN